MSIAKLYAQGQRWSVRTDEIWRLGRTRTGDEKQRLGGVLPADLPVPRFGVAKQRCVEHAFGPIVRHTPAQVAEAPADLMDRRVEITGPVDRKMVRIRRWQDPLRWVYTTIGHFV